MGMTGDFRGLGQLSRNIELLARVPAVAAKDAARKIEGLIGEEFDQGKDPYGRPWKPLAESTKRSGRREPPLTDTRHGAPHMRDGLKVKPLPGAGIAVTFDPDKPVIFHQKGTKRIPARPPLPTNALPTKWGQAIEQATDAAAQRAMEGKR